MIDPANRSCDSWRHWAVTRFFASASWLCLTKPNPSPAVSRRSLFSASSLVWLGAFVLYRKRTTEPLNIALLRNRFYFDEIYAFLIKWTQGSLATVSAFFDRWILDGSDRAWIAAAGPGAADFCSGSCRSATCRPTRFLFGLGIIGLDLLHGFPLMLLFIVIRADCRGAPHSDRRAAAPDRPARRGALTTAGDACDIFPLRSGARGIPVRSLIPD